MGTYGLFIAAWLLRIYSYIVLADALSSWILRSEHPIRKALRFLSEPILSPIRQLLSRFMGRGGGMPLDFSPFVAMILLSLLSQGLVRLMYLF